MLNHIQIITYWIPKSMICSLPMGSKRSTEIQMERKMLQVKMGFKFFQPDGSFNVNKQKPQEYCWYAKALLCKRKKPRLCIYQTQNINLGMFRRIFGHGTIFYLYAKRTGPRHRCWQQRTANGPGWTESKSCRTWWQCKWRILRMPERSWWKSRWKSSGLILHMQVRLTSPWYLNES